jgi:hypothetical protein
MSVEAHTELPVLAFTPVPDVNKWPCSENLGIGYITRFSTENREMLRMYFLLFEMLRFDLYKYMVLLVLFLWLH